MCGTRLDGATGRRKDESPMWYAGLLQRTLDFSAHADDRSPSYGQRRHFCQGFLVDGSWVGVVEEVAIDLLLRIYPDPLECGIEGLGH
jgi:hypothetical protein